MSPIQTGVASTTFDVTAIDSAALKNDVTYAFAVRGIDSFGNTSLVSDVFFGTPKAIDDFYNHYRGSGGENQGGCATLGNAGWIVALLGLALLFRRKRSGAALLLAATIGAGAGARAEEERFSKSEERFLKADERPPRRLLFALKIDRYDPQIDTEAGLVAQAARPYHDIFHGRAPLRWQLEVDWQVAHPFGALLIGGTVGYWQNISKGLNHETGLPSDDTALLDVVPVGLIATYRFDWPADRFNVPIIPYAQLGLQKAYWASFNGRGDVSRFRSAPADSGDRGSGWTTGWTSALGFALALDWLDPSLAREAFNDIHLQRTSLFAEYGWTNLTGFGKSKALILSDRAWRFGLALEF